MRRTRLYQILICLLCLFPVWSQAQSLTQYEYWFDDNFSARKSAGLSGYEADIDVAIDASRLGNGLHKLCLRVQQSDGMYSPVTTHYFFKAQVSNGGKLEYWFDGNRKKINTVDCHVSSDGEAYLYTSGLDLTAVTPGYHTMFYRFTNDDGTTSSAVSVASVIVTSSLSNGGKLEYWFDDDRENVYTVGGKVASTGDALIFNSALDLKDVSQGMHRMYYRLVDAKGKPNSAVSMTPVLVKSKYISEAKNSKVVSYSVSVDDQTPVVMDVLNPSEEITIPYNYDARALKAGEHTLKTTVWNSLGTATTDNTKFNVVAQETPIIHLEVSQAEGVVTASFNSIPNDLRYRIIRQDKSGNKVKVADFKTSYPNTLSKIDEPIEGTYTYYVQSVYTDYQGNQCLVTSNEVDVAIAKNEDISEKVKYGSILGCIKVDNQQLAFMPLNLQMDVTFSDGVVIKSGGNGLFVREGIPVGKELTMTVKNNTNYTFTTPSVVVDENTRKKMIVITATPVKNEVVEKSNDSYDLVINSDITGIPDQFSFEVKNTTDKAWSGNVYLIAVKEKEDKTDEGALSFAALNPYHKVGAVSITGLKSGATKPLDLKVTDFPIISKNTPYNFYLISESDASRGSYKLVEAVGDVAFNPRRIEIEKTPVETVSTGLSEDEIEGAVSEILSNMKKFSKYGGQFADALNAYSEGKAMYGDDTKVLQAFSKELKEKLKAVGDVTSFLSECKSYYDAFQTYKDWDTKDDFEKFVIIMNKICELSGPYAKIYKVYMTALEKSKEAIERISIKLTNAELAHRFESNLMKFKIKVIGKDKGFLWFDSNYSGEAIKDAITSIEIHMKTLALGDRTRPYVMTTDGNELQLQVDKDAAPGEYVMENTESGTVKFWMKIRWKNGRISIVPLMNRELVDYDLSNTTITVTFMSESSEMADIIHLKPVN